MKAFDTSRWETKGIVMITITVIPKSRESGIWCDDIEKTVMNKYIFRTHAEAVKAVEKYRKNKIAALKRRLKKLEGMKIS
jgi:hypothetical protein